MLPLPLELRPVRADDAGFLRTLYRSTRADEVRLWGWDEAAQSAFLDMQFNLQQAAWRQHFDASGDRIVAWQGVPVGRCFVDAGEAFELVDLALLPEYRQRGIGTQLLQDLQATAARHACRVQLAVVHGNPAQRLYARLGFQAVGDDGVRLQMHWTPAGAPLRAAADPITHTPLPGAHPGNDHVPI